MSVTRKAVITSGTVLTVLGLAAMLLRFPPGVSWLQCKMAASTGFVVAGLGAARFGRLTGWTRLAALAFCWAGDWALAEVSFLSGLGLFLLGHVFFCLSFALAGINMRWVWDSLFVLVPAGVVLGVLLFPSVPPPQRFPVLGYMIAISAMAALAWAAFGSGASCLTPVGAMLFYVSDIGVALEAFGLLPFRVWKVGLPLYYAGVLMLAVAPAFRRDASRPAPR